VARGDCPAAARLRRDAVAEVNAGRVPAALQEELVSGANAVAGAECPRKPAQDSERDAAAEARRLAAWLRRYSG
jgi:hypothetical protein